MCARHVRAPGAHVRTPSASLPDGRVRLLAFLHGHDLVVCVGELEREARLSARAELSRRGRMYDRGAGLGRLGRRRAWSRYDSTVETCCRSW